MKRMNFLVGIIAIATISGCSSNPSSISIEWTTASEVNTAGFNIYRSDDANGPFAKINPQIIPTSENSLLGGTFRFQDTDIVSGKAYYYLLEDIELGGAVERHGPIAAVAHEPINTGNILVIGSAILVPSLLGLLVKQFLFH